MQVVEVASGDTIVVAVPQGAGVDERRVSFASVRAPRTVGAGNTYFGFEVRARWGTAWGHCLVRWSIGHCGGLAVRVL